MHWSTLILASLWTSVNDSPEILILKFIVEESLSSHWALYTLQVNALETEGQRHVALMLLCLLLPLPHLTTLRYIMCFLSRVAKNAASNKMDTPNLAVCMAPNILHNSTKAEKMNSESKLLHVSSGPALLPFLVVCFPLNCHFTVNLVNVTKSAM